LRKYANNQRTRRGKSGRKRTSHTHRGSEDLQGRIGHQNLAAKQEGQRARRAEQVGILQATVPIVFWIFPSTPCHDYLFGRRADQRQKDSRAQTLDGIVAVRISNKVAEKRHELQHVEGFPRDSHVNGRPSYLVASKARMAMIYGLHDEALGEEMSGNSAYFRQGRTGLGRPGAKAIPRPTSRACDAQQVGRKEGSRGTGNRVSLLA
jgi:hypothetical protein